MLLLVYNSPATTASTKSYYRAQYQSNRDPELRARYEKTFLRFLSVTERGIKHMHLKHLAGLRPLWDATRPF